MLEAQNIDIVRSGVHILRSVHVAVSPGCIIAICGPNGAGKSTLLSVMAGDIAPDNGTVRIDDAPFTALDADALARRRAVLEQSPNVAAAFTVRQLVDLGANCARLSIVDVAAICEDAMAAADIAHFADARVDRLSGGERARAHLARVFAQLKAGRLSGGGRYLLLDEPTASLDLEHQIVTMRAVKRIASDGVGVLVVLHDLNLAAAFADRALIMQRGRVVANGPMATTFTGSLLSDVYGVPIEVERSNRGTLRVTPTYSDGMLETNDLTQV